MKPALLALNLTLAAACAQAQSPLAQTADRAAIEHVLQASAADWSHGDLGAYMQAYENAPDTTYIGRRGLVTGYDAIQARYAENYPGGSGHGMGKLSLSILQYKPLDPAYVLVTGRFALARAKSDGGEASGIFTVLMHHAAAGWRITYDHSS